MTSVNQAVRTGRRIVGDPGSAKDGNRPQRHTGLVEAGQQVGVEEAPLGGRVVEQPGERDEPGPGQQLGESVHRPAVGGCHLVVEADRLRSVGGEERDQEQAPGARTRACSSSSACNSSGGVWIIE